MDSVADLWPVFGLLIQTPRLRLRLPREDDLPELARAARVIAAPGEPQLHLPWMYQPSPGMERQLLQRYWRALAHWKPESPAATRNGCGRPPGFAARPPTRRGGGSRRTPGR